MEKSKFVCLGHVFNKQLFYTSKDEKYNAFTVPGGAAFIQYLLSRKGLAKYEPLEATCRCEHIELQPFEDKETGKTSFFAGRRLGFVEGNATPSSCDGNATSSSCDADYTVVYDADMGSIALPPDDTPVLWASNKVLPAKEVFDKIASRCFLLLDVDVLRNSGAMISSKISWERSATELVWQLQNNPVLSYLHKVPHLLVTFAEDGAVYVKREKGVPAASLVLAHGGGEGTLRGKHMGAGNKSFDARITNSHEPGDDSFAMMTACLALQLPMFLNDDTPLKLMPVLKSPEKLLTEGYSLEQLQSGCFDIPDMQTDAPESWFEIPFTPDQSVIDPAYWCISNNVGDKRIFDIACQYVMKGAQAIKGLPRLTFGALTTIDRHEIEAFRNICNLIDNYVQEDSVRPLSIAVFGAPGSGKSFGVTQIAKNILPGKVEKLEFNVSQFTGNADLGYAFQKVRDVTLEGKLPLVFFDEFDSSRDSQPLGWVKSFLMPMQDGKFKDESGEHPLGKCILVFAGGTAASFEEFIKPMQAGQTLTEPEPTAKPMQPEPTEAQQAFKNVKGPDFVSRLRGTINILGPNPKDASDINYVLRRALLLRALCMRKLKMTEGIDAPISRHILYAMLLVPKYRHGARSMEAILDMSRIEDNTWEPVSLPFYSQLDLHVDADAFIRLVLREVMLNSHIEKLAVAIHEKYLKEMIASGSKDKSNVVPWDELSEEFKDSNRNQARDIATKLESAGYDCDSGDSPYPSIDRFDDETVLSLAIKEHQRWMEEKWDNGWRYAPVRDNEKKLHPLLVEWDKLDPAEKKKDIDAVNNIFPLLKNIGFRVYKVE